jgi:hypothetical protein
LAENRSEQRSSSLGLSTPVLAEALRSAAAPAAADAPPPAKGEDRVPVLWRVFGGTVLSILALVAVTVYQQFSGALADLRGEMGHLSKEVRADLGRFSEAQGEAVKQDKFASTMKYAWDAIKELRDDRAAVTAVKERVSVLMETFKVSEEQQKELAREVQQLRELRAAEDERRALQGEVQRLRERLSLLEGKQGVPPGRGPGGKSAVTPASHREPAGE